MIIIPTMNSTNNNDAISLVNKTNNVALSPMKPSSYPEQKSRRRAQRCATLRDAFTKHTLINSSQHSSTMVTKGFSLQHTATIEQTRTRQQSHTACIKQASSEHTDFNAAQMPSTGKPRWVHLCCRGNQLLYLHLHKACHQLSMGRCTTQ